MMNESQDLTNDIINHHQEEVKGLAVQEQPEPGGSDIIIPLSKRDQYQGNAQTAALAGQTSGAKRRHPHEDEEIFIAKQNPLLKEILSPNAGEPHLMKFKNQISPHAHKELLMKLTDNIHQKNQKSKRGHAERQQPGIVLEGDRDRETSHATPMRTIRNDSQRRDALSHDHSASPRQPNETSTRGIAMLNRFQTTPKEGQRRNASQNVGQYTEEEKSYLEDHKIPPYNASLNEGVRGNPFSPKDSSPGGNNNHHQMKQSNANAKHTIQIDTFPNRGQPRFSSGSENDEDNGNVTHQTPKNRTIDQTDILGVNRGAQDLKVSSNRRISSNMRASPSGLKSLPRMALNEYDFQIMTGNLLHEISPLIPTQAGQNTIGQPNAVPLIEIKRDLLSTLAPDYQAGGIKNSAIQKIIMRRRSKELDRQQNLHVHKNSQTVLPALPGLSPLNRPSFNFYDDINNDENRQFIETERGQDLRRGITPADIANQVLTSQGKIGNNTQNDQTQKYDIQLNESASGIQSDESGEGGHEKGMPMFFESRDYGVKGVTIDKLSPKDHRLEDEEIVATRPPFNLEDDSLDKDKFGEYVRQNAGLKPNTSISTYNRQLEKQLDQELLGESYDIPSSEGLDQIEPNPFDDQLLTDQKKKFGHHFEKMKTSMANTDSKHKRQSSLMNNGHATDAQAGFYDGENLDLIIKSDRRLSKLETFSPSVRQPHLDQIEDNSASPAFMRSKVTIQGKKMKISENKNDKGQYRSSVAVSLQRISLRDQAKKQLTMPVPDFMVEESDFTDRFKVDINAKPMLDDERARKMIIGELQAKRLQEEMKKDSSFFLVVQKTPLELVDDFEGKYAWIKRPFCRLRIHVSNVALAVISSRTFETISVIVIILNSLSLAIEDPTSSNQSVFQQNLDMVFLALYTTEMILKVLGMGFILNENSYLRDGWNMIDFIVVIAGYLQLFIQGTDINLGGLRTFRVLRPLRSIQRIEGLKRIVQALLSSLPLLGDTIIILLFFFFIFAIAGLQLFGGILKRRCVNENTGLVLEDEDHFYCGYNECPPNYFCGKTLENPNFNQMNFDTIFYALVAIFTSVTLEGWTSLMSATQKSLSPLTFVFHIPLVFIGAFFLLNLTLAVIKSKFSEEHQKKNQAEAQELAAMEEMDQEQLDKLLEKKKKLLKRKGKHIEEVEFEMLETQEQLLLIAQQSPIQKIVMKKWKTIMFIKDRMREHIKRYRLRKERKAQLLLLEQVRARNNAASPSKLETQENLQTEVQNGFEDEEQASMIKKSTSKRRKTFKEDIPIVIKEAPESDDAGGNMTPIKGSGGVHAQEARAIDSKKRFSETKKRGNRSGMNYSPELKEQMMVKNFKDQANSVIVVRRPVDIQDMDQEFFLNFIDRDLDTISHMYSENDLIKMARQFKSDYEPQVHTGLRKELLTVTGIIQVSGAHSTKPSPKLTTDEKGTSLEAVQQSKERFLNEFSLPKINEDTGEHDHTGKKRSDEQSSEPNILVETNGDKSPESPSPARFAEIDYTPKGDSDEQSPLRVRDSPQNTQRDNLKSAGGGTSFLQSRMGGDRPGTRKNLVISSDEGVSFKIKPGRVRNIESEQKQSLLENDEIAPQEEALRTSQPTPTPEDLKLNAAATKNQNKVMPFNPGTPEVEVAPQRLESMNKDIINIERSVLNSRFIVEQEIDKTQKLHIRKDKIEFASAKDVLEDRHNKQKILKQRAMVKVMKAIPDGFQGYLKSIVIKPYQRRQIFQTKSFLPDEGQSQCLQILDEEAHELETTIQKQYDQAYKTGLYVTSTISICVKKTLKDLFEGSIETHGFRGLRTRRIQDASLQDLHIEHFSSYHSRMRYMEQTLQNDFNVGAIVVDNLEPSSERKHLILKRGSTPPPSNRNNNQSALLPSARGVISKSSRAAATLVHPITGTNGIATPPPVRTVTLLRKQVNLAYAQPMDPKAILQDVLKHLFFKNQSVPQLSRSHKTKTHNHLDIDHLIEQHIKTQMKSNMGEKGHTQADDKEEQEKELKRRNARLAKQAARDLGLQRKMIVTYLNRGALQSRLYRHIFNRRKNTVTPEEMKHQHIAELYDNKLSEEIQKIMEEDQADAEENSEVEEEEDSDEEDAIKDDFLDMPLDFVQHINKARLDTITRKRNEYVWSGQDVLIDYDPSYAHVACEKLGEIRVWPRKVHGVAKIIQVYIKKFVRSKFFDNFLTLCVFLNTVCLGMDRYGMDQWESDLLTLANQVFTWIFIAEMILKVIGLGPIKYLRDKINHLDGLVVVISIAELVVTTQFSGAHQSFRMVRIFRIFRIIRVGKLLRTIQSMQIIMDVLIKSMNSFIYLALLLLLFIFIFTLLGMQIFGGNLSFDENYDGPPGVPRNNFDTFNSAFLTTFQVLTMEGWHQLFYDALRSDVPRPISALYYISWVFLGNFMLLNLFLAILLDSFTNEELHKPITDEQIDPKKMQEKHIRLLRRKEGAELIEYYSRLHGSDAGKKAKKNPSGFGGQKKKKSQSNNKNENLLDESFEYDEKALTTKNMDILGKNKVMYEGVQCERAFYILSKESRVRTFVYNICMSNVFEWVIMTLVISSSIKLVIDSYLTGDESQRTLALVSDNFDKFFTTAFAIESLIRATALGFCIDQGSYLRETWSQIDFFIVVISIIDVSFEQINVPVIKILRLFRTLRPLRFISHNSGMKTIVSALVQSVGGILNVAVVVFVVWMMFGILAVNLFGGKLNYCSVDQFTHHTKDECLKHRGEWLIQKFNYDSVPQAMLSLFTIATMENWPNYMYQAMNIQGEGLGPKLFASPENGYFFVIFILIGSFLFLNLFVGVIFSEFENAQQEEKATLMLKENQIKWVDMMKMIVEANPDLETTNRPKQRWRQIVHEFITGNNFKHNYFDYFVMSCIILNMILLAVVYDDSSQTYNNVLDSINYFFTLFFAIECILKLLAFGPSYFENSWNVFDFFVVCSSAVDIILDQMNSVSLKFLRVGPQLARILRVLRISRLFRLLNKYKGLQALIQTIQFSLPALFNVFALLMLIYFIFSILATFLFKSITEGEIIDDNNNFNNFGMSMLILIRISTGEDWNYIMKDTMLTEADHCIPNKNCGSSWSPLFFFPYMILCTFIMLNLFILVIIQQFETYYLDADNVIARFKEDTERFKQVWTHFTMDHNCIKIKDTRLVAFMGQMDAPLGMKGEKMSDIIKSVVRMELSSDNEGFVYFNELLFRAMRRVYGDTHVKNKILIESEINTIQKIEEIKRKMIKKSRVQERLQAAQVNPFSLQLFMNASFRGWLKLTKQNLNRRLEEQALGFGKVQMPTFVDLEEKANDNGGDDDLSEEEHEEEIFFETLEDIELEDSNSFVSEDMMDDDGEMTGGGGGKQERESNEQTNSFHEMSHSDEYEERKSSPQKKSQESEVVSHKQQKVEEVKDTQEGDNSGGQLKSSSSSEAFRQHLDDVRSTKKQGYLAHPEDMEKKNSNNFLNMLHLDLKPTINFNTRMIQNEFVEEQEKESSDEMPGYKHVGSIGNTVTVRSLLDSQAREIVQHRKRIVEKHFKGSSNSSQEDSEAGEDQTAKVQPQTRGSPSRIKKAFGSGFNANESAYPHQQQQSPSNKFSKGINKKNPKFLKFKQEYYQNKIEIDSDFDDEGSCDDDDKEF